MTESEMTLESALKRIEFLEDYIGYLKNQSASTLEVGHENVGVNLPPREEYDTERETTVGPAWKSKHFPDYLKPTDKNDMETDSILTDERFPGSMHWSPAKASLLVAHSLTKLATDLDNYGHCEASDIVDKLALTFVKSINKNEFSK